MTLKTEDTHLPGMDRPLSHDAARALYRRRFDHFTMEERRLSIFYNRLANLRLLLFVFLVIGLWKGLFQGHTLSWFWLGTSLIVLAGFLAVCGIHRRIAERREFAAALASINNAAEARLDRRWADAPQPAFSEALMEMPLVRDLDLTGNASLLHLLGGISTPPGRSTLSTWLVTSVDPRTVNLRQEAVRELLPDFEFRQNFQVVARKLALKSPDVQPFLDWIKRPAWLLNKRWLGLVTTTLTVLSLTTLVMALAGIMPFAVWLAVSIANLLLSGFYRTTLHRILDAVDHTKQDFFDYGNLFRLVSQRHPTATALITIQQRMSPGDIDAFRHLRRLHRIMELADLRFSPMLHIAVQALTLWDFHVLRSLEKWRLTNGPALPDWFAAIGEFEALLTVANLAWDHPDWSFPVIRSMERPALSAVDVGHPLLHPDDCVRNDVTIGPPSSFLLVTGSNMSGKSTLLRAIGVNVCLAGTGAPVCAREFNLPPVILGTCFRIQDSLASGTSFFLAEIQRIKHIIDLLKPAHDQSGLPLLYLFDELLLGTNINERQIAVKHILHHLLTHDAIGALATHDLTIAEDHLLKDAARAVHFHESFRENDDRSETPISMTFDYRLKPGIATTTNALKLLELVGLINPHDGS